MSTVTHQQMNVSNEPDCRSIKLLNEKKSRDVALREANICLAQRTAQQRVSWALKTLPGLHILSSSFGAQAAVSLHMLTQLNPDISIVFIDTGYHFPETYRFTDQLCERLKLNLKVVKPSVSAAWQEARSGQRWNDGLNGIEAYNHENKVEPMQNALSEMAVGTWFAGLRATQATSRARRQFVEHQSGVWKVHPILDWTDKNVFDYLREHKLPYHPLWDEGYVSIGDVHTTRSLHEVDNIEATRFFGLKRECGLHEFADNEDQ